MVKIEFYPIRCAQTNLDFLSQGGVQLYLTFHALT
jgi:hypothetical protein